MVLTFLFLIISTYLGFIISDFFIGKKTTKIELFLISYIVGLVLASYSVLVFSLLSRDIKTGVYLFLIIVNPWMHADYSPFEKKSVFMALVPLYFLISLILIIYKSIRLRGK